jgi:hypothetical protein
MMIIMTIYSNSYLRNLVFLREEHLLPHMKRAKSISVLREIWCSSAVKMLMLVFWVVTPCGLVDAVCFSQTSVSTYKSTRRYNPEDHFYISFGSKQCLRVITSPFFFEVGLITEHCRVAKTQNFSCLQMWPGTRKPAILWSVKFSLLWGCPWWSSGLWHHAVL